MTLLIPSSCKDLCNSLDSITFGSMDVSTQGEGRKEKALVFTLAVSWE